MNAQTNALAGIAHAFVFVPKTAVVVEVKDRKTVVKSLDALAKQSNRTIPLVGNFMGPPFVSLTVGPMQTLKAPDAGYVFATSASSVPLPAGLRPTLLMGREELVFATSPPTARRARDLAEQSGAGGLPPGDALAASLDHLPDRLTFLSVSDPRESLLPDLIAALPGLAEFAVASQGSMPLAFFGLRIPTVSRPGALRQSASGPEESTPAVDPELIPEADAVRPFLFPSVSALAVDDQGVRYISREAFPTINPATMVPVALAMLIPATQSSRVAARRAQSTNNLKQIGLALHNFHNTKNRFPADVRGKDGKPLLSWRVQILPFLDQQALFIEFAMDEPWDSPHNKALLEQMPSSFAVPGAPAEPGMTFYRGFSGDRALFDAKVSNGVAMTGITDGTSNTIAVVEAKEAVPWTKPDSDIASGGDEAASKVAALEALRDRLGGHFPNGFNAVFCDGSVRFIRDSISLQVLRALITRDGGEVISSDAF
jgi:prepilin-type processing-associated H-X9-DG protein